MNNNNSNNNENSSSYEGAPMVAWVLSELEHRPKFRDSVKKLKATKMALQVVDDTGAFGEDNENHFRAIFAEILVIKLVEEGVKDEAARAFLLSVQNLMVTFLTHKKVDSAGFYVRAKLDREMLVDNGLSDYIEAANNSRDSALSRLDFLNNQQDYSGSDPNHYICIFASSGTGKTQLAATAALTYKKATTIYLNMAGGEGAPQRFYAPHITNGSQQFQKAAAEFLKTDLCCRDGEQTNASTIKTWSKLTDVGSSPFVRMLYHLFTEGEFPGDRLSRVKLSEVKDIIRDRENKFLVFLDEIPPQNDGHFSVVLCIRDTLRYLGIAPILMGTHTGAQDFVAKTSRTTLDVWTWIMSSLPRFVPFPEDTPEFFAETERPLVLAWAAKAHEEGKGLAEIVGIVRKKLQTKKLMAWTMSPALQLAQLFSTDVEVKGESFSMSHNLVGEHFGCLLQGDEEGKGKYSCGEAANFAESLAVAPVCASYEPLLYLALATWDEEMLNDRPKVRFPLTDTTGRALTVREAYRRCIHVFTSKVSTENSLAEKLGGNLLEVLVHASMTLASMKTSSNHDKYLPGVKLQLFITLVRQLMVGEFLEKVPSTRECNALFSSVEGFLWPDIPALGGFNSGLPEELADAAGSNLGFLERDGEMVDGRVWISSTRNDDKEKQEDPCISVECKNFTAGVDSTVLEEVFKRIKANITCCLVFVLDVKSGAFRDTELDSVKKECFKHHDPASVSTLVWKMNDETPGFLRIGGAPFCATRSNTKLLVVIIEVGKIEADIRKRKRGIIIPCANP